MGSPQNTTRADATAAWVSAGHYVTYVPADRSGEWVTVFEPEREIIALYGEDAAALSQAWLDQVLKEQIIRRVPGGMADRWEDSTEPVAGSDAYYAQMPRDPAQLINWILEYNGDFNLGAEETGVATFLIQELEWNVAPADLRVAMYRALSTLSNGVVVGTEGTVVTLAFPTYAPNDRWDEISIDTDTALVTRTSVTFGSGGTIVPDTVPNSRSTPSLSIVDSAP
ncbi:hypothetical protein [Microbacterium sp. LWH12-1.2]|uniref:hypothetical protein n=1 Tax=Microbacterium sp. LWH12-1.2 TaxID=3135259 RepID=UPI003425409B